MEQKGEISFLKEQVVSFGEARNWEKFHSPKNLSMALAVEASELLEIFQWMNEQESKNLNASDKEKAAFELADIFMYTLLISDRLNVDLKAYTEKKIEMNEQRFPSE